MASSSSPRSQSWLHDVFPSFHGTDVRKNILSHILKEFIRKGISTFIDNEIQRGESIGPELKRAIKESKIAIVLLSKNYASSSWCLDELVEIMNKVLGQKVLTIFYDVDPSDVKKQTGDFGKVFEKACLGKTKEKIETWRKALEGVATIAGYHSRNWDTESDMVEKIASDICGILNSLAPSPDLDLLIGMGDHIKRLQQLLRLDLVDEVRMIGILGPPGIGKSTIAHSLFIKLSNSFPLSAIIVDIRGSYPRPCLDEGNAQRKLQKKMLSKMLKQKDIIVTHLGVAQERLKHRKVLLVVDDVDQLAQLKALAGHTQWFGLGSRIIIITEDRGLLNAHGMISDIYQVPYPSSSEALQMFCVYAFGQKFPEDGFRGLAHEIVRRTGNLPLGLEVMGSHFKRLESTEEWSMELPRVTSLDQKIERILRFSYDALSREDKDIFIHIACFFNNETIEKVVGHLVKSFSNVRRGLDVLAEKSLISTDWGMIKMHSLLAQLGKEIVREQCDRRFLNDNEDIRKGLINPTTMAKNVIGINSTYNMPWGKACEEMFMTWPKASEKAFEEMSSLKFLRLMGLGGLHITPLKYISPKLQLLDWGYSSFTSFPSIINVENLVEIKMVGSNLEKLWEGIKQLQNLKWIDLSSSRNLKELPDLSNATHLQELNLSHCWSLMELPFSIGRAINLQILDLSHCSSLTKLPFSIGHAINLQILDLNHCSSLVELPSSIGHAANLRELNLFGCSSLVKLPSFGKATSLQILDLGHCSSLVELPSSIGNATNLQELDLRHCSSLVELPSSIGNATNLQELDLRCCSSLVTLPTSIGNLQRLTGLNLSKCSKLEVLPTNINLESLTELNLTDCSLLKSFPEISTNITFLYLVGTAIKEVPSTIRSWSRLKEFEISYHENLKDSPHAFDSITELHLTDTGIQEIGPWIKGCSRLVRLKVSGCTKLVSLPQLPDSISELDAKNCVFLERLDCSFRNPKICLNFLNCFKLNQEATDLIIQTSTRNVSVLPGGEVPACFTYRASGGFVTLELNEKPLCRSTKFKACILLVKRGEDEDDDEDDDEKYLMVKCTITSKQNALTSWRSCGHVLKSVFSEHLYVFDLEAEFDSEAEEVTSTELVFEFELQTYSDPWKIKECGVLQLLELKIDEDSESFSFCDEDSDEERSSHMYWGSNKRLRLE